MLGQLAICPEEHAAEHAANKQLRVDHVSKGEFSLLAHVIARKLLGPVQS